MRGFMRAIGLGGLLKNSPRHAAKNQQSSFNNRRGGPAMCTLVPVDDLQRVMHDRNTLLSRSFRDSGRHSSIEERPQFLFFCGSDNSGVPAARRMGYANAAASPTINTDFSFSNADVQARASTKSPTRIHAPTISHRMPVFFAPQHGMMHGFE